MSTVFFINELKALCYDKLALFHEKVLQKSETPKSCRFLFASFIRFESALSKHYWLYGRELSQHIYGIAVRHQLKTSSKTKTCF